MKRFFLILLFIFFSTSQVYSNETELASTSDTTETIKTNILINEILDTELEQVIEEDYTQEETEETQTTETPEIIEVEEEKIIDEDTIVFDIDKYNEEKNEDKFFKLQIEQSHDFIELKEETEYLNFDTEYTHTTVGKSQYNNTTTISTKMMTNPNFLNNKISLGLGTSLKEYMPIADLNNYSMLATSLYANYNCKRVTFESSLNQNNNIITETFSTTASFGPKIHLSKSAYLKSAITKNFNSRNIYGEISLIYQPIKSKREIYIEFNSLSTNTQYNVSQQRIQIFGKIKI